MLCHSLRHNNTNHTLHTLLPLLPRTTNKKLTVQFINIFLTKYFCPQNLLMDFFPSAALFDESSRAEEAAFERAIQLVNDERTLLSRSRFTHDIAR